MNNDYYDQVGKAFIAGLETLSRYELMSLANFYKAEELVRKVQEAESTKEMSVARYNVSLEYDPDTRFYRVFTDNDYLDGNVEMETKDPKQAAQSLAHWFDHELGLRIIGIEE